MCPGTWGENKYFFRRILLLQTVITIKKWQGTSREILLGTVECKM